MESKRLNDRLSVSEMATQTGLDDQRIESILSILDSVFFLPFKTSFR